MHLPHRASVRIALSIILIAAIFICHRLFAKSHDDLNPTAGLEVALRQSGISPLTITTTVTNKNAHPVTVLGYNSPLDPLALELGLLSITPRGNSHPLELPTIHVRRMWPPRPDSLISFDSGASKSAEIVLQEHVVSRDGLEKASVLLNGRWDMAWNMTKDSITDEVLEQLHTSPDVFTGVFASNKLELSMIERFRGYAPQTHFMRQWLKFDWVPVPKQRGEGAR